MVLCGCMGLIRCLVWCHAVGRVSAVVCCVVLWLSVWLFWVSVCAWVCCGVAVVLSWCLWSFCGAVRGVVLSGLCRCVGVGVFFGLSVGLSVGVKMWQGVTVHYTTQKKCHTK